MSTDTTSSVTHRNGVDTPTLFATLNAVKEMPARRSSSSGRTTSGSKGTHSRSTIHDFFGVGEDRVHEREFVFDADHPAVLVGKDNGPTPVEFLLHALAACLTAGIANIAAARKVTLTEVRSTVDRATSTSMASSGSRTSATATSSSGHVLHQGRCAPRTLREIVEQSRGDRPSSTCSPTACRSRSRSRSLDPHYGSPMEIGRVRRGQRTRRIGFSGPTESREGAGSVGGAGWSAAAPKSLASNPPGARPWRPAGGTGSAASGDPVAQDLVDVLAAAGLRGLAAGLAGGGTAHVVAPQVCRYRNRYPGRYIVITVEHSPPGGGDAPVGRRAHT